MNAEMTGTVVVGVDGSEGSWVALRWAAEFAVARALELVIAHGLETVGTSWIAGDYEILMPSVLETVREQGEGLLARAEEVAAAVAPGLLVSTVLASGTARDLLIERSRDAHAVVLGATGNTGTVAHLGSTLLAVTAHARGPVVVVRGAADAGDGTRRDGPVVVGVDDEPVGSVALAAAFAEADASDAELVAVHCRNDWAFVGPDDGTGHPDDIGELADRTLARRLEPWQRRYPRVRVTRRVEAAEPGHRLLKWSERARLVVVGSHGRGGLVGLLLGSTTNRLVQHAACPVMVVHAESGDGSAPTAVEGDAGLRAVQEGAGLSAT